MTTTANLSGDEIPKRLSVGKSSDEEKKKALKDALLKFEKSKKGKKKKVSVGDIIRRKNLEDMMIDYED